MKETVEQLKELLGDDFAKLVRAFDEDNRQLLLSIEKSIADGDSDEVFKQIHSLKGASANIGAVDLSESCAILEKEAHAGDLVKAKEHLAPIKVQFEDAVNILKSI